MGTDSVSQQRHTLQQLFRCFEELGPLQSERVIAEWFSEGLIWEGPESTPVEVRAGLVYAVALRLVNQANRNLYVLIVPTDFDLSDECLALLHSEFGGQSFKPG